MKKFINCNGNLVDLSEPSVMGILNITPDSFYDGGKYKTENFILNRVEQIINEGAKFVDIGAFSSRPGADKVEQSEELKRLNFALKIIKKKFNDIIISVDTFNSDIAKAVVKDYEVSIINDISGGNLDNKMFETIAELNIPYIIMHMQGNPKTMQTNPIYENITKEIIQFFSKKIELAKQLGIKDLIIDPGFGFGKTQEQNYELLINLDKFSIFELPLIVGLSRKSMIYKLLNTNPENALTGTIALNFLALQKGIKIIRVHDVKEAVETIKIYETITKINNTQ